MKRASLTDFDVLHFATHALVSEQVPGRSALVLSRTEGSEEDGFLQAREIYGLELSSELVVLSACRTARGRLLTGEGVEGLSQAFFFAGAQSVLASLWNVDDAATAEFMDRFYRQLSAGRTKRDALRAAKLELLDRPETASPRLWAPFILIGDADRTVPLAPPRALDLIAVTRIVALLLIAGIVLLVFRRMVRTG